MDVARKARFWVRSICDGCGPDAEPSMVLERLKEAKGAFESEVAKAAAELGPQSPSGESTGEDDEDTEE